MASRAEPLWVHGADVGRRRLLVVHGVLDAESYRLMRDTVVKAALDEPDAVIIDVTALEVPASSAWSVFTSARWLVSVWPDVPLALVSNDPTMRAVITRSGVTRYVPVFHDWDSALPDGPGLADLRRRAKVPLPRDPASVRLARVRTADWLTAWHRGDFIPSAGIVATVFVENVLKHTLSTPVLRVEARQDTVTVAVEDADGQPACRHETGTGVDSVAGLAIVSAVARTWGSAPTQSGKTVWALLGPESRL